ncbi:MAG: DUF4245 domain-containing protein [Mycobacteriaceae bacterium]
MPADKPRHLQGSRDMVLSMAPLVLLILLVAGAARACSFSPGGPSTAPPPTIDAQAAFANDASNVSYPIRAPKLPDGWVANSANTVAIGSTSSSRVGFITTGDRYLRLAQSSAAVAALLPAEVDGLSTTDSTGTKEVGGTSWTIYVRQGGEPAWVADLGPVRLLITGSGTPTDFNTLARAVLAVEPLTS